MRRLAPVVRETPLAAVRVNNLLLRTPADSNFGLGAAGKCAGRRDGRPASFVSESCSGQRPIFGREYQTRAASAARARVIVRFAPS